MSPSKTQPALLGGVVIGVLSALPVVNIANCCCAWILFGGALAAYLMQQNHPEPITAGDGAIVGLLSGVIGAFVWAVVSIPVNSAMAPFQARMFEQALANAGDMPPDMRAFLQSLQGAGGAGLGTAIGFLVMLCVGCVFGMLGGILGALMFRKNAPPPPPPAPSFTPPPGSFTPHADHTFTPPTFTPPPPPGGERR